MRWSELHSREDIKNINLQREMEIAGGDEAKKQTFLRATMVKGKKAISTRSVKVSSEEYWISKHSQVWRFEWKWF